MELTQKNRFIKIGTMLAGIAFIILAITRIGDGTRYFAVNASFSLFWFFIATCATIFKTQQWVTYLLPLGMLILTIISGEHALSINEQVSSAGILIYPMYTFFLVRIRTGLLLTSILGLWATAAFLSHGRSPEIFGMSSGEDFLISYLVDVVLCFLLELFREQLLNKIFTTMYYDKLTGLRNREGFLAEMEKYTSQDKPFFLILTDFDHFSRINTNLGTVQADELIRRTALALANPNVIVSGRWYGDQFAILFMGSEADLSSYAQSARKKIEAIPAALDLDILLTSSAGICEFPMNGHQSDELIKNVECALVEAKKGNRRTIHRFNPNDIKLRLREHQIEQDLPSAIESGQIELHFQPKVSVQEERVVGMEALLRWYHPTLGYIILPEFVAIAERSGMIGILGDYVVDTSFAHFTKCKSAGLSDISISVNISPSHLLHRDFLAKLLRGAEKWEIDPAKVVLEITESVIIQDEVKELIESIQENDFELSLDDFGTGYSSLSYLSRFKFNELKIDKSFTDTILTGERDLALFKTILQLASQFGMKTVVEGVETKEQQSEISLLGADEIQGWYYSKALASDQFIEYAMNCNSSR